MPDTPIESRTAIELWVWRHPRPIGAAGRCIGHSDLPVDPRRARRLARRIETTVRNASLPREVWTSPLARCADIGRLLARRGFTHRIDARLAEFDFGAWDGQAWESIGAGEVAQWEADFAHHRPGGGESLSELMQRAAGFLADRAAHADPPTLVVVGHAGWINAVRLLGQPVHAAHWPAPIGYGSLLRVRHGDADA